MPPDGGVASGRFDVTYCQHTDLRPETPSRSRDLWPGRMSLDTTEPRLSSLDFFCSHFMSQIGRQTDALGQESGIEGNAGRPLRPPAPRARPPSGASSHQSTLPPGPPGVVDLPEMVPISQALGAGKLTLWAMARLGCLWMPPDGLDCPTVCRLYHIVKTAKGLRPLH